LTAKIALRALGGRRLRLIVSVRLTSLLTRVGQVVRPHPQKQVWLEVPIPRHPSD
jgi:hypothetical protein